MELRSANSMSIEMKMEYLASIFTPKFDSQVRLLPWFSIKWVPRASVFEKNECLDGEAETSVSWFIFRGLFLDQHNGSWFWQRNIAPSGYVAWSFQTSKIRFCFEFGFKTRFQPLFNENGFYGIIEVISRPYTTAKTQVQTHSFISNKILLHQILSLQ